FLEFGVLDLPGREVRRSNRGEINTIELDEHELLTLELAQTDLFPCRAGEREIRCFLPDLQGRGLPYTNQHTHQQHTDQYQLADAWCSPLHGLSPPLDRTSPPHHPDVWHTCEGLTSRDRSLAPDTSPGCGDYTPYYRPRSRRPLQAQRQTLAPPCPALRAVSPLCNGNVPLCGVEGYSSVG